MAVRKKYANKKFAKISQIPGKYFGNQRYPIRNVFSLYYYELGISIFFNEPLSIPELTGEAAHKLAEGDF